MTVEQEQEQGIYPENTPLCIEAHQEEGWEFFEWQGSLTGNENPATITMDSDKQITAVFLEQGTPPPPPHIARPTLHLPRFHAPLPALAPRLHSLPVKETAMAAFELGRVFGIRIRVHWLFILLLLYYLLAGGPSAALMVVCVFACVVLHELGHSLMARCFGIGVRDITLLPSAGWPRSKAPCPRPRPNSPWPSPARW